MLTIWNRRQIAVTWDGAQAATIRAKLQRAGIRHTVRSGRGLTAGRQHGAPNIRADYAYEYRIYVHRRDADRAGRLLG